MQKIQPQAWLELWRCQSCSCWISWGRLDRAACAHGSSAVTKDQGQLYDKSHMTQKLMQPAQPGQVMHSHHRSCSHRAHDVVPYGIVACWRGIIGHLLCHNLQLLRHGRLDFWVPVYRVDHNACNPGRLQGCRLGGHLASNPTCLHQATVFQHLSCVKLQMLGVSLVKMLLSALNAAACLLWMLQQKTCQLQRAQWPVSTHVIVMTWHSCLLISHHDALNHCSSLTQPMQGCRPPPGA